MSGSKLNWKRLTAGAVFVVMTVGLAVAFAKWGNDKLAVVYFVGVFPIAATLSEIFGVTLGKLGTFVFVALQSAFYCFLFAARFAGWRIVTCVSIIVHLLLAIGWWVLILNISG